MTRGRPKKEVPENKALEELTDHPLPEGVEKSQESAGEYKLEVIRDYYGKIDPFRLSKSDPNFEYRFLRDNQSNLSMKTGNLLFSKGGWQLCNREHLKRIGIEDRYISPDGLYRVGDTVLAFMPKKLYAEKEAEKRRRAEAPMDSVKRLINEGDPNNPALAGTGHENMRGLQTARQLGMK